MSTYSEMFFYSPMLDSEAVRISMWNEAGGEFFQIIPLMSGRVYRERRSQALSYIEEAIRLGLQPGEVKTSDDYEERRFAFCK